MKFTLDWLFDHLDTTASLDEIATRLTAIGLEVEEIDDKAKLLAPFTVGYIKDAVQHPNADRLRICTVDTGSETLQIVCGAPNARAGIKVVLSRPGDFIPGLNITLGKSAIRGVDSQGMLCAADELGLGEDHSGIMELPTDAPVGAKLLDVMPQLGTVVIDINLTPNRSDCAGVRGIARDLAAAGLGTLKPLKSGAADSGFSNPYSVAIENKAACSAFGLRLIKGVKNGPSPAWLRARLEAIGVKPISALVDITNYLTFDQARPLHVFDAAKVAGQALTIRNAKDGETMEALNNKTYTLDPRVLVISDSKGVESLAGVMGGLSTGCDENTTDVLIECALFSPESAAATGRALQISSDARYRFERGVDPQSLLPGIAQATQLILDICGGEASAVTLTGEIPAGTRKIHYMPQRLAELTGVDVPAAVQTEFLQKLGCIVAQHHGHLDVTLPSWRPDLAIEEDLVEEVLRLSGYDAIPATSLPPVVRPLSAVTPAQKRMQTARRLLAQRGGLEVVSWSFMPVEMAARFAPVNDALTLVNPIAADMAHMRPSIVGNLLSMAARNAAHGQHTAALFEVGPVYKDVGDSGQENVAALVRHGPALPRHIHGATRAVDLADVKGDLAALLGAFRLDIDAVPLNRDAPGYYHPGRSFALRLGPTVIAHAGALHPSLLKAADVNGDAWAVELFLDRLPQPKKTGTAKPLLKLPPLQALTRDFAFTVARDKEADALVKAIRKVDRALITDVALFDVYAGDKIAADKKSLALTVTIQPQGDKALTDAEIEALSQKIVVAAEKVGAALRG